MLVTDDDELHTPFIQMNGLREVSHLLAFNPKTETFGTVKLQL